MRAVYSQRPMRTTSVLALALLFLAPRAALGADPDPSPEAEPESDAETDADAEPDAEAAPAFMIPAIDDLGRPFPDPLLVRRGKIQTVAGIAATGTGAALMVGGLFFGSSLARGEVTANPPTYTALGGLLGGGIALLSVGLPTLSVGTYTTKQLDRTIKGAEKIPRTVANEDLFWKAVMSEHMGRTLAIGGGGTLLMGVVSVAAVAATVDTEFFKPWYWAIVGGTLGAGAGLVGLGVLIETRSRERQEAIRDEVDPYRKKRLEPSESEAAPTSSAVEPVIGVPVPTLMPLPPTASSKPGVAVSLGWSFVF